MKKRGGEQKTGKIQQFTKFYKKKFFFFQNFNFIHDTEVNFNVHVPNKLETKRRKLLNKFPTKLMKQINPQLKNVVKLIRRWKRHLIGKQLLLLRHQIGVS